VSSQGQSTSDGQELVKICGQLKQVCGELKSNEKLVTGYYNESKE